MARVNKFSPKDIARASIHAEVEATFHIFTKDGDDFLQIDTYGAPGRQIPGKISQSVQFGREGRMELRKLLDQFRD